MSTWVDSIRQEVKALRKDVAHWKTLYQTEHNMRLAAEDAYESLLEMRRSERPEQLATELEIDRWQQQH
jgi:hypothetical protein